VVPPRREAPVALPRREEAPPALPRREEALPAGAAVLNEPVALRRPEEAPPAGVAVLNEPVAPPRCEEGLAALPSRAGELDAAERLREEADGSAAVALTRQDGFAPGAGALDAPRIVAAALRWSHDAAAVFVPWFAAAQSVSSAPRRGAAHFGGFPAAAKVRDVGCHFAQCDVQPSIHAPLEAACRPIVRARLARALVVAALSDRA